MPAINKKGNELTLSTIIIFIIAIVALVFLIILLTSGGGGAFSKIKHFVEGTIALTNNTR